MHFKLCRITKSKLAMCLRVCTCMRACEKLFFNIRLCMRIGMWQYWNETKSQKRRLLNMVCCLCVCVACALAQNEKRITFMHCYYCCYSCYCIMDLQWVWRVHYGMRAFVCVSGSWYALSIKHRTVNEWTSSYLLIRSDGIIPNPFFNAASIHILHIVRTCDT